MTRFLLIRHAMTDSVGKRASGRMANVHLNDQGHMQAQLLAERLAGLPITGIYSSPLERATETAEPLAKLLNLVTEVNEHFLELDFGDWTNRSFEQLEKEPAFRYFNAFRSCTRVPGGELMLEAQTRMITGLQKLGLQHNNETVAVISHSDLIRATIAYYAGIHLDMFQRIEISPASVSIVEVYEETTRIQLINHTGPIII